MIFLLTDFGAAGHYVGQMKAVLASRVPALPVFDFMHDAPAFNPKATSYLLPSLVERLPAESILVGVVDPGVGTGRPPVIIQADDRFFVGPGNGLFEMVIRQAAEVTAWRITWEPESLSASFHGRDLFAPVAAYLAQGQRPEDADFAAEPMDLEGRVGADWPDELAEIVYIDAYGNATTGLRAANAGERNVEVLTAKGPHWPKRARTFADMPEGVPLYYENAQGLMEIAVNRGRADRELGLAVGMPLNFV